MLSKTNFIKNSILTFSRNIAVIIVGLLISVLIARILGPEKQGLYSLVILLPSMLMTLLNLGVGSATVYFTGKKKYDLQTIVSTNVILALILSMISIVVGVLVLFLFHNSIFNEVPITLLLLFLGILPILFFNSFLQSVFHGLEDFKTYNAIALLGQMINLITLIVFIYLLPLDLTGALISYTLGHIVTMILIISVLKAKTYKVTLNSFSFNFLKESLSYGYKAHMSNIISFLNYRADILLIAFFLTPAAVGIYNVAIQIAERLWILSGPVATVLFPRISSTEKEVQNSLTAIVSRNVLFLSIIVGVLFYLLSDFFVWLLFGSNYIEASEIIRVLLPGITVFASERILSNSLAGKGRPELNLYTSLVTLTTNIILNVILIPKYGLVGAAFATSVSYTLTYIIKTLIYLRITNDRFLNVMLINKSDLKMYRNLLFKLIKRGN